jgi:sulfate permease, SulP family
MAAGGAGMAEASTIAKEGGATGSGREHLASLSAGVIVGFTQVILGISLGSLIFSGPLAAELPRGVAIGLVTAGIISLITAWFSSSRGAIGCVQDSPTVLLAVAAASLAGTVSTGSELVATVVALIFVTTLLTSVFLVLLGTFDLGRMVRFIPYPVIGGFLAGTGWLLAHGALGVMLGESPTLATLPDLFTSEQLTRWIPGVSFGVVLFVGVRRIRHFLALPGLLLAGLVVFFVLLVISGTSLDEATQRGLTLGDMGSTTAWHPLPVADLAQADWPAIMGQAGSIGTIVVLVAVSLLLNVSGMELAFREDVDLNRELRVSGYGNMLSGLAGGMIGYHALSLTMLRHRTGAQGRAAGIVAGVICLIFLIAGAAVLAHTPRPLLAGLLLFLGLDFLYEWVVQGRRKLGRVDYVVVLLILGFIAVYGFLVGVSVGLVLMVALFVINYSRTNIFQHTLSGAEVASHVSRNAYHRRALTKLGRHVYVLQLHGFIFFGTANAVLEQVRERLKDAEKKPLQFLVLDFRRVTGLDSSAAFSLTKVKYLAEAHNFTLVLTHLAESTREELARNGLTADEHLHVFPDLDHGLEWCEDQLLERDQITKLHIPTTLQLQLADNGFATEDTERLKTYLERIRLAPGDYLIRQGEDFTDLFFIEIGQVSIYLELDEGKRVRLQTLGMGTIVGELGFFLSVPRSASVIADLHTVAHRLTLRAMEQMKVENPDLVIAFNEMMLRMVSERLVTTDKKLAALNR